jgi:hypothetical protein
VSVQHWYISTHGDDVCDGRSASTAWRTPSHAGLQDLGNPYGGSLVHLAPGTYRGPVVVAYPGYDASNPTRFVGDPECQWFPDENPGRVRVTACGESEVPAASGNVVTCLKAYIEFIRLHIDGAPQAVVFDDYMGGRWTRDCVVQGGYSGQSYGQAERTIFVGGRWPSGAVQARNCIAIGGDEGFHLGNSYNCLALGGTYGFYQGNHYNGLAVGSSYGFHSCAVTSHCCAISCWRSDSGVTTVTDCYAANCSTRDKFSADGQHILLDLRVLADLLPWVAASGAGGLLGQGDNTAPGFSAADVDVSGHRLRLRGANLDIGPWAPSVPLDEPPDSGMADWTTCRSVAPSVRIEAEGDCLLQIPAQCSRAVTVTVWARHDGLTGDRPQIVLRGDSIAEQVATSTASDGEWQRLLVTATPSFDEVLTLVLRARNSSGTCRFSDLAVG